MYTKCYIFRVYVPHEWHVWWMVDDGGGGLHIIYTADECGIHFFPFYLCAKIRDMCIWHNTPSLSVHMHVYPFFFISKPKWRRPRVRVKYFNHSSSRTISFVLFTKSWIEFFKIWLYVVAIFWLCMSVRVCGWFDSHLLSLKDNIWKEKKY